VRPLRLLALLLAAALGASCAGHVATPPPPAAARRAAPAVPAQPAISWHGSGRPHPTKVLMIVEENHTAGSALAGMPYLASLSRTYGYATSYRAVTHPSLPNYLAIAGGSTFGVADDRSPASHPLAGPSVFDRVIASGRTAKTYADAMPTPCALTPTRRYAVKHNPWTYFSDPASRANCRRFDVPAGSPGTGALRADIDKGRLPHVGLLIPDICNDGHDCSLATADTWLRSWLQVVMAGPDYRAGRLAIVVTFDEDDSSADNTILTTVVSPYTSHVVSSTPYTHYSLLRYLAELTGTTPLRAAATATSVRAAFGI
jgi:acid phosphatase